MSKRQSDDDVSFHDEKYLVGPVEYPEGEKPERISDEQIKTPPPDDPWALDPEDKLAQMYAKPKAGAGAGRLTIEEGPPPRERRSWPWVRLFVLLLVLGGLVAAPLTLTRPLVDAAGEEQEVTLAVWALEWTRMSREQRALQGLSASERFYVLTRRRVEEAWGAAQDYFATAGRWPDNAATLAAEGYLDPADAVDGWGFPLRVELKRGEIEVRAVGADGLAATPDDVALYRGDWSLPSEYETERISRSLGF